MTKIDKRHNYAYADSNGELAFYSKYLLPNILEKEFKVTLIWQRNKELQQYAKQQKKPRKY